ncbi:PQQ-binding-like beta-propeller repeat protein [Natrarchaeobius sp. A-rgal3]|uniref:outer membrane protein assembly factor BamB family protein n=1 Tax=Natrarchaeobius versutus TaxID=1679078 RepID=UPI0035105C0B
MSEKWPFVRRTPANPGSTSDSGPRRDPVLEWKHDAHARIFATPLVADGRVYVTTTAQSHWEDIGCVVAIDRSTGERVWMSAAEAMEVRGTPGLSDGTLYAADLDNQGFIVDAIDGRTRCFDDEMSPTPADGICPLVHDETVFTTPYRLEARDADSWELRWSFDGKDGEMSVVEPPAIDGSTVVAACENVTGERIYVGQDDGYPTYVQEIEPSLRAFDADTGSLRWKRTLPGRARSPAIVGGVAYLTTRGSDPQGRKLTAITPCTDEQPIPDEEPTDYRTFGTVHAIDVETGTEYWSRRLDDPAATMPAIYRDTVCFGTAAGTVATFDAETGERRWETRVNNDGNVLSWPTIATDTVYVGSRDEGLYALDRRDGSILWQFETKSAVDSNPAIVGGTVFVGDNRGTVYAIGGE